MMSLKFLSGSSTRKNCLSPSLWMIKSGEQEVTLLGTSWTSTEKKYPSLIFLTWVQLNYILLSKKMPRWILPVQDISFEIPAVSKLLSFAPESSFCPCLIYSLEASISNRFLISDPLSSSCLPLLSSAGLMPTLKHKESAQFCFLLLEKWNQFSHVGNQFYSWIWVFLDST